MPTTSPTRRTVAAGAAAIVLLAAAGALALGHQRAQRRAEWWVQHTFEVMGTLSATEAAVIDAETAQRGYLLVGEARYAAPLATAEYEARATLGRARQLTADNARQQARLDTLALIVNAKLEELHTTLRLRDRLGAADALAVVRSDSGLHLTSALRALIERMTMEERRLLEERQRAAQRAALSDGWVTGLAVLLTTLLALGAAGLSMRAAVARDQARRALRESATLTRAAMNASGDAIYILHCARDEAGQVVDFTFVDVNAPAETELGFPREAIIGRRFGDLVPVARTTTLLADFARAVESGVVAEYERAAVDPRRLGRWFQLRVAPLGDGVMFSTRDVTERRRAVAELEMREERYRLMARYFPNGMVALLDRELRFLVADGAGLAALHLSRDDFEGRRMVETLPTAAVTALIPALETALGGGEAGADIQLGRRSYSTLSVPVRDADGSVSGALLIAQDITERTAMERLKGELVATVSHELRTPLTSIRGALGLLEGGISGPLSEQAASLVRIARGNSERLIRLVNDVLDLEKIEAQKVEYRMQTLRAADVVPTAAEGMHGAAMQAGVRIVQDVRALGAFEADRDRVLQVLTNLLSNAVKFAPPGTDVVLRAEDDAPAGIIRLMVEDRGPGIPADKLDGLFQKFHQVDASDARARGGTGLGLAITRAIVEQHGGRMGVASEPGVRTAFWCELPAA